MRGPCRCFTGVGFVLALTALSAGTAQAQTCAGGAAQACNATVHDVMQLQPRLGIGLVGGNPVAGASSTLGMRIGRVPRITVAGRVTGVNADVRDDDLFTSINLDAAVGVFSGLTLLPTIGGFGSLDAIASAGKVFLADRVSSEDPSSWALGLRLGLLRESFTAPGVSVTGMYRKIGDAEFSLAAPSGAVESYAMTDNSALSVRAVVGKRLFVLGATAGVGWDKYQSDIDVERSVSPLPGDTTGFAKDGHKSDRLTIFGNVSWTMLILNLVVEGGWQGGGDRFTFPLPSGQSSKTDDGTYYGSLAIRLAL